MNANELRIGNLVYDTCRELNKLIVKSDFMSLDYRIEIGMIKPILLTPDVLKKLGFIDKFSSNLRTDNIYFEKKYFVSNDKIFWFKLEKILNENGYFSHNLNIKRLKILYVHQLQNLYFALTGEELVVSDAVS